jgi:hypothetical protein
MDLARAPRRTARKKGSGYENETYHANSLDLGLYSAGNYRIGHLPRRGLVHFTSSQISPITLWSEIDQKPTTKAIYTVQ